MHDSIASRGMHTDLVHPPGGRAQLVAAKHWGQTPLGAPATWSASLKLTVELILACGFPMAIRWGPEMVMIYNDAYAPILGDKHPRVLGAPLREVWPEIYDELGPLNESILRGERDGFFARDHLWRIFRRADTWEDARFTISYSPIPDDTAAGRIGGILATAVETTDRVDTEQRLRQLSEKLEQEVTQRTRERDRIWQVSEDLLGVSNFEGHFLSVNPAWTALLGWSEDEIKRMHVSELRHADGANGKQVSAQGRLLAMAVLDADHRGRSHLCHRPAHHRGKRSG